MAAPGQVRVGIFAFAAGVAVLSAEVVWSRSLLLLLGGSVDASATVLSAVMLGLAAGAGFYGRRAGRGRDARTLRTAALLSSVFSFLPLAAAGLLRPAYPALADSGLPLALVRGLLGIVLVFPACFFAGGFIPLIASLAGSSGGGTRRISALYAINSAGSALGGLAAGLVLLEAVGATLTLAASSLLLALSAFLPEGGGAQGASIPEETAPTRGSALIPFLYFLSGAVALAWEAVWARQLTFMLGNSTYAFALMSSAALAGMAAGAAAGKSFGRRAGAVAAFGVVEALLATTALLPLAGTALLPRIIRGAGASDPLLHDVLWYAAALATTAPASFFMGATFPAAVRAAGRRGGAGAVVGRLSMANSAGAAAGPFLASRLLFGVAGVSCTALVLAAAGGLIALAAAAASGSRRLLALSLLPSSAALAVASLVPAPGSGPVQEGLDLLHFDEDRTATVAVFGRGWDDYRSLRINGVEEVPVDQASLEAFDLLGHLPWGYDPEAGSALVIAFGGGITAGALLSHPLDTLVCVEICPAVVRAAPLFGAESGRPDLDPRFALVEDDGRNYLSRTSRRFDLVVCDATHPGSADSWVLYTREFYEDMRSVLTEGGVAAQWVPLHSLPARDLAGILRTWSEVFPECAVHLAGGRHAILIGSREPLSLDVQAMFDGGRASSMLESAGFRASEPGYLAAVAAGGDLARADIRSAPANLDDLAPCQFLRRRAPRDPQATIGGAVALILSLRGTGDEMRSGQVLYWMRDLPGAVEAFRGTAGSAIGRRWLAVALTSAAEGLHDSGRDPEASVLLEQAQAADSLWPRSGRLELILSQRQGAESPVPGRAHNSSGGG